MKPDWLDALQAILEMYGFPPAMLQSVVRDDALRLFPKVDGRLRRAHASS